MTDRGDQSRRGTGPTIIDNAISALNGWFGDYLSETENGLQQPMAFFINNRPVEPETLSAPTSKKVCVLVHGLGCNESLWKYRARHEGGDYGKLLEKRCGLMPLYLRFNTGLRISTNGKQLAALLDRYCTHHGAGVRDLVLIGHSMGGLVIRSACHQGTEKAQDWVSRVRHAIYLGSPHSGAPLEKATNIATNVLGRVNTTATRVVGDVLNTRSEGIKDLRFGNLDDQDWQECNPDELLNNRRIPIPWLATAHHHLVVGQALKSIDIVGDVIVRPGSASGQPNGSQPGVPGTSNVMVMKGLNHIALARHPSVYDHIEGWVNQ